MDPQFQNTLYPELSSSAEKYQGKFPSFARPRVVGFYSNNLEQADGVLHDTSALRFVQRARDCCVEFDLNLQLESAPPHMIRDHKINHLLQYLLAQERLRLLLLLGDEQASIDHARVVCYRSVLALVSNTPYNIRESWSIVATYYQGNIYMHRLVTGGMKEKKAQRSKRRLQLSSWGYKFRQYMLIDSPTSEPDLSERVDDTNFNLVLTNHLNNHQLLYMAAVDGIRCDRTHVGVPPSAEMGQEDIIEYLSKNLREFVGIHTHKNIRTHYEMSRFKSFNLFTWWNTLFLSGTETLLVGFRNDSHGTAVRIKAYNVLDIPQQCKGHWDPSVCFNFLDAFLAHVKSCLSLEVVRRRQGGGAGGAAAAAASPVTLRFDWAPERDRVRVADQDPSDPLLPDWFLDHFLRD